MKVVEIAELGGPEVLRLSERQDPVPRAREVLIRVHSSGVNRADLLQRRGRYPPPPGFPSDVPGLEFAGEVVAVGGGAVLRSVGDRVMGLVGGGGYAELVTLPEEETIRIPKGMSMAAAAGVPEAFMTAWDALVTQARLSPGEVVLIHAAGSGVGTAAIQVAGVVGARSVGTTRTPDKLSRAQAMGLELGVVAGQSANQPASSSADWSHEIAQLLGGRGVDVILDLVGADYLDGNLRLLASRARWMLVGVPGGNVGTLDLRTLMAKRAAMIGTVLRTRSQAEKAELAREFERAVVPLFEEGRLRPVLDRSFPVADAAEAHRYLEENRAFGTVVLAWA